MDTSVASGAIPEIPKPLCRDAPMIPAMKVPCPLLSVKASPSDTKSVPDRIRSGSRSLVLAETPESMIPMRTPFPVGPESQTKGIRIILMSHWRKENRSNCSAWDRWAAESGEAKDENAIMGNTSITDNRNETAFFTVFGPPLNKNGYRGKEYILTAISILSYSCSISRKNAFQA